MKTSEQLWKEQYELLLQAYTSQQIELAQWRAGGILWTWEDVQSYGSDDLNLRLSQSECEAILKDVIESHDPNRGITWMVIDRAIRKAKDLMPISLTDFIPTPAILHLVSPDLTSQHEYTSKRDILRYLRSHGFFASDTPSIQKQQLQGLVSGYTWDTAYGKHSIKF